MPYLAAKVHNFFELQKNMLLTALHFTLIPIFVLMESRYCVIMAGGIGTKLWPRSRKRRPKQFLDILGCGKSLIRQTYERFLHIVGRENFLVVTTRAYYDMVLEHLPELEPHQILCESVGRNTAPAVCYAAHVLQKRDPDAVMIVTPVDHYIDGEQALFSTIKQSEEFARQSDAIVTLGIKPTHPEVRYGYIQTSSLDSISKVKCFTEKPSMEVAMQFLQHQEFYWNTGLFVATPSALISTIDQTTPSLGALFHSIEKSLETQKESQAIEQIYSECKPISIDQGVMQRARNIYICRADFVWSDIGTWGAVHQNSPKDCHENAKNEGVFTFDTRNSYISTKRGKTAVVSGLDGYVIVDTEDLLMVCPRREEQNIKRFIDEVKFYKSGK